MYDPDDFLIGGFLGISAVVIGTFILLPWLLIPAGGLLLAVGGLKIHRWWKNGRFKNVKPAETKFLVRWLGWGPGDNTAGRNFMYLGCDHTMRWWYDDRDRKVIPQAIDDGKIYWNKAIIVENEVLRKHLHGFFEMGNEWPEYYRNVLAPQERVISKKKNRKKRQSREIVVRPETEEEKRERENFIPAEQIPVEQMNGTAASASNAPILQLINTVKELEEDVTGKCPTIDFRFMNSLSEN